MVLTDYPKYFLAFLSFSSFSNLVSATCYLYGGKNISETYKPCNGTAPVSMCCHRGVSNNNGDVCGSGSSYGLCGITGDQLWRESCTDPTWKSPACLQLCTYGKGATGDIEITACDDGSYCCGQNNGTCCDAGQGVFIVNKKISLTKFASTLSSASSSTTSSQAPSQTSSAISSTDTSTHSKDSSTVSPGSSSTGLGTGSSTNLPTSSSPTTPIDGNNSYTSSPFPTPNNKLGTGATVGLVIGTIGGLSLIAIGVFFLLGPRKNKALVKEEMADYDTVYNPNKVGEIPRPETVANRDTSELDGCYRGQELLGKPVDLRRYEMPT